MCMILRVDAFLVVPCMDDCSSASALSIYSKKSTDLADPFNDYLENTPQTKPHPHPALPPAYPSGAPQADEMARDVRRPATAPLQR